MLEEKVDLSISCVYFDTPKSIFEETLKSIIVAVESAKNIGAITNCIFFAINNNQSNNNIFNDTVNLYANNFDKLIIKNSQGNIGYGRGNNLAIAETNSIFHLIVNPDVILDPNALSYGISYLIENKNVGLLAPISLKNNHQRLSLAKRKPSPSVLLLRALDNEVLNRKFKKILDNYCYGDIDLYKVSELEIELASGCFMLCRTSSLKLVGGFSKKYFLYFEDFDLSNRLRENTKLIQLSSMKIFHHGGNTKGKNIFYIFNFIFSYIKYVVS